MRFSAVVYQTHRAAFPRDQGRRIKGSRQQSDNFLDLSVVRKARESCCLCTAAALDSVRTAAEIPSCRHSRQSRQTTGVLPAPTVSQFLVNMLCRHTFRPHSVPFDVQTMTVSVHACPVSSCLLPHIRTAKFPPLSELQYLIDLKRSSNGGSGSWGGGARVCTSQTALQQRLDKMSSTCKTASIGQLPYSRYNHYYLILG